VFAEAKAESRLIHLSGHINRILSRNQKHFIFFFWDEVHGELLVTADKESPLFYSQPKVGTKLELKVYLKGYTTRRTDGNNFTNNYLMVKEIVKKELV
jgi:hypothetical protein